MALVRPETGIETDIEKAFARTPPFYAEFNSGKVQMAPSGTALIYGSPVPAARSQMNI